MCRNIKTLFNFDPPVTDDEVRAASLQFVRKISGFTKPSKANEGAFQTAVEEVAAVSMRLLRSLEQAPLLLELGLTEKLVIASSAKWSILPRAYLVLPAKRGERSYRRGTWLKPTQEIMPRIKR